MKKLFIAAFILFSSVAVFVCQAEDVVTNDHIVKMLQKGYSNDIIIGFIDGADQCSLKADMDAIDALMAAGANSELISYIQKKIKKDDGLTDGLYWWNAGGKPQKLNIVALEKESKGFGGAALGVAAGIAGTAVGVRTGSMGAIAGSWIACDFLSSSGFKSDKLVINGEHAHVKIKEESPVFRLIIPDLEKLNVNPGDLWYYQWLSGIQSPNEFQLIKLQSKGKEKKAKRVFPAGMKWSAVGFESTSTSGEREIIDFEIKQINNRTYEIYFPDGIEPGEYAFFYKNAQLPIIKEHLSAFDFTIPE